MTVKNFITQEIIITQTGWLYDINVHQAYPGMILSEAMYVREIDEPPALMKPNLDSRNVSCCNILCTQMI